MAAQLAWYKQVNGDNLITSLSQKVSQSGSPGMICMTMNWIWSPCNPCLARQQGHCAHVERASTSVSITSQSASGTYSWCRPLSSPGAWDHMWLSAKGCCVFLPTWASTLLLPTAILVYSICLFFLALHVVVFKSQQGTNSWRDQLISLKCSNRQQVGNSFWSKAMLRQHWKWRLDDQLQNLKCPVANQDRFKQTQILKSNLLRHWRNSDHTGDSGFTLWLILGDTVCSYSLTFLINNHLMFQDKHLSGNRSYPIGTEGGN